MNKWSTGFFGRNIINDWKEQLNFTTKIFRARGLHLDDRHIRDADGVAMAASIVDMTLYVVNNYSGIAKSRFFNCFILAKNSDSRRSRTME